MKKAISVFLALLVLIVCLAGSAVAEDFSVRNGVKFGMTKEEVDAIEKTNGSEKQEQKISEAVEYEGSVAGENANILYIFVNNGLYSITYQYAVNGLNFRQDERFEKLKESLTQKYGESINLSDTEIPYTYVLGILNSISVH